MVLGIIGVGHLAGSILQGLLRAGHPASQVILAPRGHGPSLAECHGFRLADDNADLVRRAEVVLLATRPTDATEAVRGLPWHDRHTLVSACAGVTIDRLAESAAPAEVLRIMPITASELGASPTLVYPMRPSVAPLLTAIGDVIELDDEGQFEAATVSAAIYGWAQVLIRDSVGWATEAGLDPQTARRLMSRTFVAAGRMVGEHDASMEALLTGLVTPGGITEAGLNHLEGEGVPAAWLGACDVVFRKLHGGS